MMEEQPKTTYAWVFKDKTMCCYKDPADKCTVTKFWEVEELTAFHDDQLSQATKQINAILAGVEKSNDDPRRHLSFIQFQSRHFLVWTQSRVGPLEDKETIRRTLRLKVE